MMPNNDREGLVMPNCDWEGQIFLYHPHIHDRFLYSYNCRDGTTRLVHLSQLETRL